MNDAPLSILLLLENAGAGSGRHVIDLARGLLATGHRVTLVYGASRLEPWFRDEVAAMNGLDAHEMSIRPGMGPTSPAEWWRVSRFIRKAGPFDIVHGHSSKAGALARLAAPGSNATRVYTPHALFTMGLPRRSARYLLFTGLERVLARFGDAIVCVSEAERRHAVDIGLPGDKLFTVPNGLDGLPAVDRAALRDQVGLREDEVCIGFVGRLARQKAVHRLIDAYAGAANGHDRARLLIVGSGPDERLLKNQAAERGLGDRVIWAGAANGARMMAAFDVFVLPSLYEAFPYVLLEAAARGLPLLVTDIGGAEEMVADGVNGFVVPQDDAETLRRRMAELIDDDGLRRSMAGASIRQAGRFSVGAMVRSTLEVYERLRADD